MAFRSHSNKPRDITAMAGWLFADLFLIIAMIFLISQPGYTPPLPVAEPPTPTWTPSSTPTQTSTSTHTPIPTATPNVQETVVAMTGEIGNAIRATLTAQPTATSTPSWTPSLTPVPSLTPTPTPNMQETAAAVTREIERAVRATLTAQPTPTPAPTMTVTPNIRLTGTAQAEQIATEVVATLTAQPTLRPIGLDRIPVVVHLHLDYSMWLAAKHHTEPIYSQVFDALRASTTQYQSATTGMVLLYAVSRTNATIASGQAVEFSALLQREVPELVDNGVIKSIGYTGPRFPASGALIEVEPMNNNNFDEQRPSQFEVDEFDIILEIYLVVGLN